jgi:hypothetical protein
VGVKHSYFLELEGDIVTPSLAALRCLSPKRRAELEMDSGFGVRRPAGGAEAGRRAPLKSRADGRPLLRSD